ncbi:hypothetical protein ACHAAC_17440 [Aeromicrobium sp. CF4.19]|uniref:hypothetical protein n=1 Tax=Aeromicrobium sp. CF4.19 TaxID=3373082 RepID=UPI003EE650EA
MSDRPRPSVVAVACLLLSAVLTACGPAGIEDDATTCGDRDWCHDVPGEGYTEGA